MPFEGLRHAFAVTRAAYAEERKRKPAAQRARDEMEFLPAALEVLETPASPTARWTFWSLTLLLILAVIWSFIGELEVVAVAEGRTVPTGKTKVIQPLETGIVRAIRVQDGQAVKAGDVLVELDLTTTSAEARRLVAELVTAKVEAARLDAAAYPNAPLEHYKPPADVPAGLAQLHRQLLMSQTEEHRSRLAGLDAEIDRKQAERRSIDNAMSRVAQSLPLLRERAAARGELAEKGFGSKLTALELRQQVVELEHESQGLRHRREEANASLNALQRQRSGAEAEYIKTLLGQRAETERKIASLEEEVIKAEQREGQQTLTSPTDGVVQQLAIHTVGGVVTPAQGLMVIVPADAALEVEVMVQNRDIGFIHPGQEVALKLETFLFTKYGTLPGRVVSVSRDAVQDEKRGLIYPARIALERRHVDVDGRRLELGAGMSLTAEIKTDQRRVIDYLLSPILRMRQESLRER